MIPGNTIPIAGPSITQKEVDYVTDAVRNSWYSGANMYHERFEKAFAEHLDVRYAVSLPSCTSAIHLSLLALEVGPGDEVIVPDATWIASAAPINYVGATPVFADIDDKTWCLSPDSLKECLTARTKAVIPVDLYGGMPDFERIRAISDRYHIAIVEDAAEAIGAEYKGRKAGSLGETGVFSFHGSKTLTTGEGGMLVTDRETIHRRVLFLRDHGRMPGDKIFLNSEVGYKYKMSGMQAALGLAQLERIDELIVKKKTIFEWYQRELNHVSGLTLNPQLPSTKSAYWMVTAVLAPERGVQKESLIAALRGKQIDCRPFFHPLSSIPAYQHLEQARLARERNTTSYAICPFGVNLPSALSLTEEQVVYVCNTLKQFLNA
jgi:perosamine synthetase